MEVARDQGTMQMRMRRGRDQDMRGLNMVLRREVKDHRRMMDGRVRIEGGMR